MKVREFSKMPLEDSPWVTSGVHSAQDIQYLMEDFESQAIRVTHVLGEADGRTSDPFIEGAQQNMDRYSVATRTHKVTGGSTCQFAEMKDDGPVTNFFLIADAQCYEGARSH